MKNIFLSLIVLLLLAVTSYGQVTNLLVNGSSSSFNIASGDQFGWSFNVPFNGDSTLVEIWIDADQNGLLNPAVDVLWNYFIQVDGDSQGQNGPPDMDGVANGFVSLQQKLGLAPAHYIMVFKNHNNYKTVSGTVTNLVSPAFTISGNVSVPAGFNKKNIMLNIQSGGDNQGKFFWDALTDNNGNFTIQMNSDTSGNPWILNTNNNIIFGSSVISPDGYSLVLNPNTSSYTGNNFTLTAASAEINGTVKDENGNFFINADVNTNSNGNYGNIQRGTKTDTAGFFRIGLLASDLPQTNLGLYSGDAQNTSMVQACYQFSSVTSGNVLTHNLTIFKTNSTISGRITINGNSPGYTLRLNASNIDSGQVNTYTDNDGYFYFNVSNKIYNYVINLINTIPGNYSPIVAHPGQSNILINLAFTDIKPGNSNVPAEFSLSQNYPNPFNPATTINYSLPKEGHVKLSVFNALGSKVATVVDEYKPAGNYSVRFNASNLSSGIYLYKLESGNYTASRKLILIK